MVSFLAQHVPRCSSITVDVPSRSCTPRIEYASIYDMKLLSSHRVPSALCYLIMNTSTVCLPNADDLFGPRVEACQRQFDFTRLFEQSILSIAPSAIMYLSASSSSISSTILCGEKDAAKCIWQCQISDQKLRVSSQMTVHNNVDCNIGNGEISL